MSGMISAAVVAGASVYGAREGHIARKDAKTMQKRVRAEQAVEKAERDAAIAEEKRKQNEILKARMGRTGTAGTIFAGAFSRTGGTGTSLLGNI